MFHKSINRIGTIALLAVSAGILASAGSEFLRREIGGVALLVVAQSTVACILLDALFIIVYVAL